MAYTIPPPAQYGRPAGSMNPTVSKLFRAVGNNQPVNRNDIVRKGSLVTFGYSLWRNDPYPLVIVTDVMPGAKLRGVNLHYLTFPYVQSVMRMGGNNPGFSYSNIKPDHYITGAFRSYKWQGIRQVKVLDTTFLLTVMSAVRSFDPTQVAAIRKAVQDQIAQVVNTPVTAMEQQPVDTNG